MAKKKTEKKEVAVWDAGIAAQNSNSAPKDVSIEALLQQAIDKGVAVETMERLLAMRTQLKHERAKADYDRSMADFQAECPTIVKTKEVRTNSGQLAYRYAPIESIVAQVKDLLQKHGFSYSTGMELLEGGVKVRMRVTHSGGHSEEFYMEVPFGTKTGVMSQTQVAAAATTFAKRYAFCNAFGILTGDEDTDAKAETAQKERMPSYQVARVVPDESDEAGGYLNSEKPPFEDAPVTPQRQYPQMDETNDAHGFDDAVAKDDVRDERSDVYKRMEIAKLMRDKKGYTMLGKTREHAANAVMNATGIVLEPRNFDAIIAELRFL